ncbi:elongation factor P maturation arginine rhamnosyltransferase EarP [Aquabacterium sp. A7-Y]|uniref:elongation factor P maturation arginine rhamnosyltransferase EarP n=1 Tax=Aquabacterium sp. A7-Y TaxID=1349605 RepID=UPI00223DFF22|nr:elongation factor P maturation arginine rhamnosyltransferase EarP [Aquabacterium sp. A7-Y]MCW7541597.1 elongation factor P maturation arginine rhamnosyltransferase EarP [Aquabacterium sp. A7-Y]
MQWEVFCRVIDNYGDLGVCWRLSADLAARGHWVRLWTDDAAPLAWMAPAGAPGVEVRRWDEAASTAQVGDVVVEAFGCELPPGFVAQMAARVPAPAWINLEYLSAESYVERSHGLRSPQFSGPGAGLDKRFYYPGFTPRTGGLLREPGLLAQQAGFDRGAWLQRLGFAPHAGERVASLFCYDNPALPGLLARLAERPQLLLVTPGLAATQVAAGLGLTPEPGSVVQHGALRIGFLPALPQPEFDRLLWATDLNFVRGEDSVVRAIWAGRPFVWQIYPQHDQVHLDKLEAFLARFLAGAGEPLATAVRTLWQAWNGGAGAWPAWPDEADWSAQVLRWRETLLAEADLCSRLLGFLGRTG